MSKYPDFVFLLSNWDWYTGEAFLNYWLESILDLTQADNQKTSQTIARNFQSCNKVAEVVNRHTSALSPSRLIINDPQLKDLVKKWQRENSGIFGHPLEEAAIKAKLDGRAYLRLFFKKSYTTESLFDSLELHCPPAESITAYRNNANFLVGFDYTYREDDRVLIERQFLREKKTVFQIIGRSPLDGSLRIEQEFEKDLGGGFTVVEINLKPLLTESIKQNQNAINFSLTLLPHNLVYSGWIQETILNAQPPGTWEYDEKQREKFIPKPEGLASGAGVTRFLSGLPITDAENNHIGYTTPDVKSQNPVAAETFINTYSVFSQSIYEQTQQSFVLSADLVLSGVSREQSRRDFNDAIDTDATRLEYVYSDLLTVCNYFLGVSQRVQAQLSPNIDRGIEVKKLVLKAQAQGLVSKRTAIYILGFAADVETELAELKTESEEAQKAQEALAQAKTVTTVKPPLPSDTEAV